MERTDVLVFDVGMGQSIFIYSHNHHDYGLMIDCGHEENFHPVDYLIQHGYVTNNKLGRLLVTNYDHDHVSGLPYLRSKVSVDVAYFAKNLTSQEVRTMKPSMTEALESMCKMKEEYTHPVPQGWIPPYEPVVFSLMKEDFDGNHETNNLSQVTFIDHLSTVICVCGDMERDGWEKLSAKHPEIKNWLLRTNIFIAPHHGRDNGYHLDLFNSHLSPECVIISDKKIIHDTQKDMSAVYSAHVINNGILLNQTRRKVLTTRSDGHIWVMLNPGGVRTYNTFTL